MDIEVQNMYLKHSNISFEVQKAIFEGCSKTIYNDFQKHSGIFPGHSGLILYQSYIILKQSMKTKENQEKAIYLYEIPYFYPLQGAYLYWSHFTFSMHNIQLHQDILFAQSHLQSQARKE